jgi:hypothetical protein
VSEDASAPVVSSDPSTAGELRATAKWMCAGAGAIATAMIAGLQLKELATLPQSSAILAVAATVLVVGAAGVILLHAASVLAARAPSIQGLANMDQADGGAYPAARIDEPKTDIMKYLLIERRLELLGPTRDSIKALVVDQNAAYHGLWRGTVVDIDGRQFDPANSDDRTALQAVAEAVDGRLLAVSAAAERWEVETRFMRLKTTLAIAGTVLVAGVLAFVWITATSPPRVRVTTPLPASVQVPASVNEAKEAGFSATCAGETLDAVIIGGWMDDPVIVTSPSNECPTHTVSPGNAMAVVPRFVK